jgi:beta-glucosidase
MKFRILFLILALCIFVFADETPDYLNPDLDVETRVEDLVSRMTLEEKVSQMVDEAEAIPRLGVPEYNWWNECLHGVARAGIATVFPQAIGLAATWNTDLMFEIADVISIEARAKHHDALRRDDHSQYRGLTFWSPNINIFRDPRWGRGQETYGECPYLTARMGVAFVKGLQGDNPDYLKVVATPKHYAVHSGPEPDRHRFDAVTTERDLYDTYLPAFEACVKEAGAYSIMCAYNRYMGEACCGSSTLLKEILREDWGFDGYIVSDSGAIEDIHSQHKITETAPQSAALAVKSGTDLSCSRIYYPALLKAVEQGLITEEEIDVSVKRLFRARFKLGMFDPQERVPWARISMAENDTEAHRALSLRAARESIVLLKNADNLLPLKKDLKKIAVIGPTADSYPMLLGNYNGFPSRHVTPLEGIKNKMSDQTEIVYAQGCNLVKEGAITYPLTLDMVNVDGAAGLRVQYFDNPDLKGDPFYTRIDSLRSDNLLWGRRIPGMRFGMQFSLRWSGTITVEKNDIYNFTIKGDDGYRLTINDQVIVEDWAENDLTEKSGHIRLEKDKPVSFVLEYFYKNGWPQLSLEWDRLNFNPFKRAVELALESDAVIFVGGITAQLEGEEMRVRYDGFEGGDRTHINLPKVQEDLLKAVQETGKPVVLVLTSGSALAVNWADEHVPAILQIWYPGQEGGTALADVLFGDYNPGGRLPVTFYKSVDQIPPFEEYAMINRTYRYFEGEPLYPFGYGLSYTSFEYQNLEMPEETAAGENIDVSVEVTNTGKIAGDEVVQLYVKDLEASVPVPVRALQGMKRVHLNPGEKKEIRFTLTPRQLAVFSDEGKFVVEPGTFEIAVGGVLPGAKAPTTDVLEKTMRITGNHFFIE